MSLDLATLSDGKEREREGDMGGRGGMWEDVTRGLGEKWRKGDRVRMLLGFWW